MAARFQIIRPRDKKTGRFKAGTPVIIDRKTGEQVFGYHPIFKRTKAGTFKKGKVLRVVPIVPQPVKHVTFKPKLGGLVNQRWFDTWPGPHAVARLLMRTSEKTGHPLYARIKLADASWISLPLTRFDTFTEEEIVDMIEELILTYRMNDHATRWMFGELVEGPIAEPAA